MSLVTLGFVKVAFVLLIIGILNNPPTVFHVENFFRQLYNIENISGWFVFMEDFISNVGNNDDYRNLCIRPAAED